VGWVGPALAGGAALAICAAVALRDPRQEGSFGTCPWLLVTGTHCPGCGTLRTLNRLVNGDVVGAASYNLLTLLAAPVMAYAWLRWALPPHITSRWPVLGHLPARAIWGLTALIAIFWLTRNLPWEPFSQLAPANG